MRERRMSKYIVSIVLALAMVIGIAVFAIPTSVSADPIEPSEGLEGSGTEADPYQIGSVADWLYFANLVNGKTQTAGSAVDLGYFQLTADITFNEGDASTWGSSAPAINLADYGGTNYIVGHSCKVNPFVGTLDGAGHTISGVYINKTGGSCGLFGSTAAGSTATIKNLIITNSYYESDTSGEAGAIIGQTSGGTTNIDCVFVTDSVYIRSAGTSNGGFIGHNGGNGYGTPTINITNSVNGATVDAYNNTVISGSNYYNHYVGGFIGNGNGNPLNITNCLNYGTIKGGTNFLAGFVGRDDKNTAVIKYSVNIGTITPTSGTNYRQFIMSNTNSDAKKPRITNCLALTTSYGKNTVNSGCAQINKDAVLSSGFLATTNGKKIVPSNNAGMWVELASVTQITGGTRTVKEICAPKALVDLFGSDKIRTNLYSSVDAFPAPQWILDDWNSGTVTITSAEEWKVFANFVNGVYEEKCTDNMNGKTVLLGDDLGFGGEDITNYIVGVTPATSFKGTFDGQNHTISGVHMYKSAADGDTVGLFGFTNAGEVATLKNVIIKNSYFESVKGAVGALIAQTAGGSTTVSNVYVDADVEIVSGDSYAGGLVGHVGGNGYDFIDSTPGIIFDSCVNAATVTSTSTAVGGILGNGNGKSYTVTNCLNMGDITGSESVGGIVGYGRAGSGVEVSIEYCVNIGTITSSTDTNDKKACAITSMGTTARDTLTSTGCYYLNGTAIYGVFEGSGESADGGATAVGISALIGETLPAGLEESGNWIARGDGTVFEICIPAGVEGFAPETTKFHAEDNTPNWLKNYSSTSSFTITTVEQWKQFASFVNGVYTTGGDFEGKTVLLGNDLDFTAEENMAEYMVGSWKIPFAGTFDGQGHTITGFHVEKSEGDTAAIFGSTAGGKTAIIKNFKVKNSYFEAVGCVGAIVGQTSGGSTEIYNVYVDSDVEIVATGNFAGGLVGHVGQNGFAFVDAPAVIIDSCVNAATVNAEGKTCVGGILGNANNKSVTITNCLNMGNITGGSNTGGILGNGTGNDTECEIYIDGCVNVGTITNTSGNIAAIANLSDKGTRTAVNCYYLKGTATNGVVSGTDNDVQMVSFSKLGGEELPENLNGEKWIARGTDSYFEICIPAGVSAFAPDETTFRTTDDTPDWLIDYADTTEFTIDSVDQWKEFADFVNGKYTSMGNFEGKIVYLGADLDFEDQDMNDYIVGVWNAPFVGTFDGQGHTISGFHVEKTDADTAGIFGATAGGKTTIIRNLKVTASYFEAKGAVGAIVGQTSGGSTEIYNVYVDSDVVIVSTGNFAGGLVGHVGQNGFDFIDGTPAIIIDSCVNAATITAENKTCVGGILGNANNKSITITNCLNMGNVTGGSNVGGIVGNGTGSDDVEMTIDGCVNVGTITNASGNVAAIANLSESGTRTAVNCYYLIGTALNGVVSGTDNDVKAASLIVLGAATLPAKLNGEKWTARGEDNVLEICVPSAVATYVPAVTSFHAIDNTPDWLKDYENTDEFTIETVEQWKELANFIKGEYVGVGNFDGKVVYLANDIDFTGEDMTEYMLGTMTIPFAGTFDGQGYTISGFSVTKSEGDTAGIFGSTAGGKTAIIKNFKVSDSHFEAAGAVGAVVGQTSGGSTEIYNVYVDADVEIISGDSNVGGLVGHVGQNGFEFIDAPALIVDSCVNAAEVTAEGNNVGGILGNANQKNITITNCLNIGNITGGNNIGGIIGYGAGTSTSCEIYIDACVNVGTVETNNSGSNVAAIANLSDKGTKTAVNCYYLIGTAANGVVSGTDTDVQAVSVAVLGGKVLPENLASSVDDDNNCKWIARGEGSILEICIPAAVEAYAPAETSFRTEDNTPEWLQNYATDEEFTIETVEQWKEFANFINGEYLTSGDFEGKTVKLGNDIDFDNEDMTDYMIGSMATPFAGTFDGQGYTISGFSVTKSEGDTAGIFGSTAGGKTAVIQNFKVSASHFEAAGAVGAVIGQTSGGSTEIYNVYVDADVEIISNGDFVGGLVGHVGQNGFNFITDTPALIVDSCVNAAEITTDSNNVGGILGNANNKNVTITNCLNMGNITGGTNVGGIIGKGDGGTACEIYIDACVNIGAINGTSKVAAITVLSDKGERTAVNCYYLIGTAAKGVESGKGTDVQAVSFLVLGGVALPENLNNGYWVARGEGDELEICIPAGVAKIAPATTDFHTTDDTPEWLRGYAETTKFTITTVEQWKEIANFIKGEYMSSGDFEGKTVELGCEIDFENEDMTAYMLGSMATPFAGTFDGNGAAIIGFRVVVEGADTAGIFGSTAGGKLATIRNLVIIASHFEAEGAVGALVGQTSGGSTVIENVYVTASVEIVSTGNYVGGLVGHVGANGYGFIDGEPALSINACVNAASITASGKVEAVGGILGNGNLKEVIITNCLNVGDITGYRYVGGIAGLISDVAEVSYCINAGDINGTSSKNYFADIATGNVNTDREVTITNCYYTDIKKVFVSESDKGTVNLEDNTPYFAIPTVDWEGWTAVEGGLPTPFVIADVLTVSANIDRSVMLNGASVRMDTPTGIRFTAQFSKGFVDSLNDIAKIGILIVPKAYLDEAGEFTVEALDAYRATLGKTTYIAVYNYKTTEGCFAKTTDEYYAFNAVLAVKPANYTLDFCARAFIELEDGTILYSDYNDTNNRRNVAAVAEAAYNDTQKLDENEGIEGYMNFVEETIVKVTEKQVVGQDPDSGDDIYEDVEVDVTKYVYSPYTAEQRAILYNFFYKEPEEPAAE